jgi:hypothetical protein
VSDDSPSYDNPPSTTIRGETHRGLPCIVCQPHEYGYTGYVRVPVELTDELQWVSDWTTEEETIPADVEVHGGITYPPDEHGWVGFDCIHGGDVCVDENGERLQTDWPVPGMKKIWAPDDVMDELEQLAEQIHDQLVNTDN